MPQTAGLAILLERTGGRGGPHRQGVIRSSTEGEYRLKKKKNATYFSNLLVLIVPETNTSRPGKYVSVRLPRL